MSRTVDDLSVVDDDGPQQSGVMKRVRQGFEQSPMGMFIQEETAKSRTVILLGILGGMAMNFVVPFLFQVGFGADVMPALKRSVISSAAFTAINGSGVLLSWTVPSESGAGKAAPIIVDVVTPVVSAGAYTLIQYMGDFASQGAMKDMAFAATTNLGSIGVRPGLTSAVRLTNAWIKGLGK